MRSTDHFCLTEVPERIMFITSLGRQPEKTPLGNIITQEMTLVTVLDPTPSSEALEPEISP